MEAPDAMICIVQGCRRAVVVKIHRLCRAHYLRYWKYGSVGDSAVKVRQKLKPYKGRT